MYRSDVILLFQSSVTVAQSLVATRDRAYECLTCDESPVIGEKRRVVHTFSSTMHHGTRARFTVHYVCLSASRGMS